MTLMHIIAEMTERGENPHTVFCRCGEPKRIGKLLCAKCERQRKEIERGTFNGA